MTDPDRPTGPIPLEHEEAPQCPDCGARLRDAQALLCLRCGWSRRGDRRLETRVEEPEVVAAPVEEPAAVPDALVPRRSADPRFGLILFAVAALIVAIAHLAGAIGFWPQGAESMPPWGDRLLGLVRLPVRLAVWVLAAWAALAFLAWYEHRPIGDRRAALSRLAAAVAIARLAGFLAIPWAFLGWTLEALAHGVLYALALLALLRLPLRTTLVLVAITAAATAGLLLAAHLLQFAL